MRQQWFFFLNNLLTLTGHAGNSYTRFSAHPWWNWQTRKIQVLIPQGVGVQLPPGAPLSTPKFLRLSDSLVA